MDVVRKVKKMKSLLEDKGFTYSWFIGEACFSRDEADINLFYYDNFKKYEVT